MRRSVDRSWRDELAVAFKGRPLNELEWAGIEARDYQSDIELDRSLLPTVVAEIRQRRSRSFGRALPRPVPSRVPLEMGRMEAISRLYATDADTDPALQRFRKTVLGGHLLSSRDVTSWIRQHAEANGPATLTYRVSPPDGVRALTSGRTVRFVPALRTAVNLRTESYLLSFPEGGSAAYVAVRVGSVLDSLRQISEDLARRHDWQPAQATAFVLTGAIPLVSEIGVSVQESSPFSRQMVSLKVQITATENDVAAAYRRGREQLRGRGRRSRKVGPQHLRLAVFLAERKEDSATWRRRMEAWNARVRDTRPDWTYAKVSNFYRDAQQVIQRLVGRGARFS